MDFYALSVKEGIGGGPGAHSPDEVFYLPGGFGEVDFAHLFFEHRGVGGFAFVLGFPRDFSLIEKLKGLFNGVGAELRKTLKKLAGGLVLPYFRFEL